VGVGTIHVAENGRDAIKPLMAAHGKIDMAFLNLDMPVMGGFTCLKVVRAAPNAFISELPVVILTAYAGMPQLEKAAELGISGFLSKPVSIKTLSDAIHKALNKKMIDPTAVANPL
jgi:DNA-binding NarL/FixJ family response regulator